MAALHPKGPALRVLPPTRLWTWLQIPHQHLSARAEALFLHQVGGRATGVRDRKRCRPSSCLAGLRHSGHNLQGPCGSRPRPVPEPRPAPPGPRRPSVPAWAAHLASLSLRWSADPPRCPHLTSSIPSPRLSPRGLGAQRHLVKVPFPAESKRRRWERRGPRGEGNRGSRECECWRSPVPQPWPWGPAQMKWEGPSLAPGPNPFSLQGSAWCSLLPECLLWILGTGMRTEPLTG